MLGISIIEESVDWQIKNHISEAVGIDPVSITSDEIELFTTPEVEETARKNAKKNIKINQEKRETCTLHFHFDDRFVETPERFAASMKRLLEQITRFLGETPQLVIERLGYFIPEKTSSTSESDGSDGDNEISEESVMALLDPANLKRETKPTQIESLYPIFIQREKYLSTRRHKPCLKFSMFKGDR